MFGWGGDSASEEPVSFDDPTLDDLPVVRPPIPDAPTLDTPTTEAPARRISPAISYDDATNVPIDSRERFPEGDGGDVVAVEDLSGPGMLGADDFDLIPDGLRFYGAHSLQPLSPYPTQEPTRLPVAPSPIVVACVLDSKRIAVACADGGLRMYASDSLEQLDMLDLGAYALLPIGMGCYKGLLCVELAGGSHLGLRWRS